MKYLVGIDAGSSSCKVGVFDTEGNCVGMAVREYPNYYPQPGMVEQDGEEMVLEIIQACKTAIEKANANGEDVLAVAFSTQGGPLALMDSDEKTDGQFHQLARFARLYGCRRTYGHHGSSPVL